MLQGLPSYQTEQMPTWALLRSSPVMPVAMSIAWLVGSLVGVTWWSMVVVMFVALLIGRWELLGDHGIQVPTMVLLSLITVKGTDTEFTYLTIVETVLGGAVGVSLCGIALEWRIAAHGDSLAQAASSPARLAAFNEVFLMLAALCVLALLAALRLREPATPGAAKGPE